MGLSWREKGLFSFLVSQDWEGRGIRHGFTGSTADFSSRSIDEWKQKFLDAFDADALFLPAQVHGDTVVDLRTGGLPPEETDFAECDAVIVPMKGFPGKRCAFGVRTADCLPILLHNDESIALIHSGWRGLACGIIEGALREMGASGEISAIIGPAAGRESYEVGPEVPEAIGERAVCNNGRLDLAATGEKIIRTAAISRKVLIEAGDICTISDERFHSFRREGAPVKSNLAFVVV